MALACETSDGSIGLRQSLPLAIDSEGGYRKIDIVFLWQELRQLLMHAVGWTREVCGVSGPVHYTIGVGNIADTVLTLSPPARLEAHVASILFLPPEQRNHQQSWLRSGEWDEVESANDVLERDLAPLARVLQCRFYEPLRKQLRLWAGDA